MKKKTAIGLLIGLIILLLGIGIGVLLNKGESSISEQERSLPGAIISDGKPSDVVLTFYKNLEKGDYEKAAGFLTEKAEIEFESIYKKNNEKNVLRALEAIKIEHQRAGYTKMEITKENPVRVVCLIPTYTEIKSHYCRVEVIEENKGEWKVSGEIGFVESSGKLPGKIEFSPSGNSPQGVAFRYFNALLNKDYSEARKYIDGEGGELISENLAVVLPTEYWDNEILHNRKTREELINYIEEKQGLKEEEIIEDILKFLSEKISKQDVEKIKGVILERSYKTGELQFCAKDVYCNQYQFQLEKEGEAWEITRITPISK